MTVSNGNKARKRNNLRFSIKNKAKKNRKQRLWYKYLETGDERYKLQYNRVRNQVYRIIANCVKDNAKKFWSYAQSKSNVKSSIPVLYNDDNKRNITADKQTANVSADFFTSFFDLPVYISL